MKGKLHDDDYWTIGFDDECIDYVNEHSFDRKRVTVDCFRVGCILYINTIDDWGVGIIISRDLVKGRCLVHWQRQNTAKWHNTFTLVEMIKKNPRVNIILDRIEND
jgi:hypothetical protein